MSTALEKSEPKTIKGHLSGEYFKSQVALALPKHLTPDRFVRVALTALLKTPKLNDCTTESVIQCMLNCSALGLEPDGRRAHLIPYGNTCTLIVDYKGIVELAKRSGDVSNVFAQIVCDNDTFEWNNGEVNHRIDWRKDRGQMYAVYATVTFKDGTKQTDVMTKSEVEAIRKRSKSGNSGPWVTDFAEMAKKTVFRRVSKWITLSPEVSDALEADDSQFQNQPHSVTSTVASPDFIGAPATTDDAPKKRAAKPAPKTVDVTSEVTPVAESATPAGDDGDLGPEPKPSEKTFEEVVDGESPEIVNLRSAMKTHDIAEDKVLSFCKARNLLKEGSEGKSLSDIQTLKVSALTKNILAGGEMCKKIREGV